MNGMDLCLAWNWEYDSRFASLLETACMQRGLNLFQVTPQNLESVLGSLGAQDLPWHTLLDRASDTDTRFQLLVDWAQQHGVECINPQAQARWANDKATMHLEFLTAGLETPHTIILPPFYEAAQLHPADLRPLGGKFAIKPARGGGGEGVVLEACTWEQVIQVRQQFPGEKYLLQAHIDPASLDGHPAWFRILFCDGAVHACWWDPHTHCYLPLRAEERLRYNLRSLFEMTRRIALLCRLDLFSTEIAMDYQGRFVSVDYVNDPVDLRLQSAAVDGVPDAIVENIAMRLALLAVRRQNR